MVEERQHCLKATLMFTQIFCICIFFLLVRRFLSAKHPLRCSYLTEFLIHDYKAVTCRRRRKLSQNKTWAQIFIGNLIHKKLKHFNIAAIERLRPSADDGGLQIYWGICNKGGSNLYIMGRKVVVKYCRHIKGYLYFINVISLFFSFFFTKEKL